MSNLLVKTVAGFLFLMLILALALFIPAGSLSYWQAWVVSGGVGGLRDPDHRCIWSRTIRSCWPVGCRRGRWPRRKRIRRSSRAWPACVSSRLFIVPGLDYRFGWSNVPPIVSLIADGFVALGFFIVFLTFRENSYTRATIEVSAGQKVITSGPYRFVRHPMYAGASLLLIFTPLALGSWLR